MKSHRERKDIETEYTLRLPKSLIDIPPIAEWDRWIEPKPSLPIDRVITKLIEKRDNPKSRISLRQREVLEAAWRRPFCPYYEMREAVFNAHSAGILAGSNERRRRDQKKNVEEIATSVGKIASDLDRLQKRWYPSGLKQHFYLDAEPTASFFKNNIEHFDRIQTARDSLKAILENAHIESQDLSRLGSPVGIWRQAFVDTMGQWFFFLTGSKPSKGPIFRDFADKAYETIGGTLDLEAAIRTVVSRRSKSRKEEDFDRPVSRFHRAGLFRDLPHSEGDTAFEDFYDQMLLIGKALASAAADDDRYLFLFCELLLLGPYTERFSIDLARLLPQLKALPRWTEAYDRAARMRPSW